MNSPSASQQRSAAVPAARKPPHDGTIDGRLRDAVGLGTPALRNIIAQLKSTIHLRRIMDERRVLVCNLAKGALGKGTAHLLGALITTAITHAALSRVDVLPEQRVPFALYADEFQNYATGIFAEILSELRKYGVSLVAAHQYLGQLTESLRDAVLGNTGTVIAFRVGALDAPILARHIGINTASALQDLTNFRAFAKFLLRGTPTEPTHLTMYAEPPISNRHPERLVQNSRIRIGRDRKTVEEKIARFLA